MSYAALGAIDCETARHPTDWWVVRSGTQGYGSGFTSRTSALAPIPADTWNCLVKQQGEPFLKAATSQLACGTGFVFTDDGKGCVNKNGVVMLSTAASNCKSGASAWWMCTPIVRYMLLNEGKALADACNAEDVEAGWRLGNLLSAIERSIEAMQEWRGGWVNVKADVHAISRWLNDCSGGHRLAVDELDELLLESIAKYYDKRRKAWDQIVAAEKAAPPPPQYALTSGVLTALLKPKTTTAAVTMAPKSAPKTSPAVAVGLGMGLAAVALGGAYWYLKRKKRTA